MNDLKIHSWKIFKIGLIFPRIKVTKYSKKPDTTGLIPFVSSTGLKNGVSLLAEGESMIAGNCITVSTNGSCFDAFYHDSPIIPSTDIEVLYNKKLNKYNALFICTILKQEKPKWSYGRKPKNNAVFETLIKLPAIDNEPDWNFMESYCKSKWIKNINTEIPSVEVPLKLSNWKKFKIGDIISNIYKAKAYHKIYLKESNINNPNSIQYITRTEFNNGNSCYVEKETYLTFEQEECITIGDTTATCFYQDVAFVCGDHIVILRDDCLNKYNGLFLKTIIDYEKYRYSYGRAFTIDNIINTTILLPANRDIPDWEYMENYIKSLPYSDRI